MVELFNIYYFLYIGFALIITLGLYFLLRKKSGKTQFWVLFAILALNLALHFLKLCFEPYKSGLPETIRKITFENICAVSTLIFPFVFLINKKNPLHDFMFFIGVIGGLGALIFPTEALGNAAFTFDTIRFYICHSCLFIVPVLAAILNIHRPRIKNIWYIPLLFFVYEIIIFINEIILIKVGFVSSDVSAFFDRDIRNSSFVFGPLSRFDSISVMYEPLVPSIFKSDFLGINGGEPFYFPILWMLFPVFIYFPIIYAVLTSPFWITSIIKAQINKKHITKKAGCILVNLKTKKIGLIYRDNYRDYEFAKGHVEEGETAQECAIRETAEETKRTAKIVESIKPYTYFYTTAKGEQCECTLFVATDEGKSDNDSTETHDLVWVDFDSVESSLSYESIKRVWRSKQKVIKALLKQSPSEQAAQEPSNDNTNDETNSGTGDETVGGGETNGNVKAQPENPPTLDESAAEADTESEPQNAQPNPVEASAKPKEENIKPQPVAKRVIPSKTAAKSKKK